MPRVIAACLGLTLALLITGCGAKSADLSAADLAEILRGRGHDVKAESVTIEQSYPDSLRSPDDKGTTYVVRVGEADKKVGIGPIEVKVAGPARYKIFIADSDGWINVGK